MRRIQHAESSVIHERQKFGGSGDGRLCLRPNAIEQQTHKKGSYRSLCQPTNQHRACAPIFLGTSSDNDVYTKACPWARPRRAPSSMVGSISRVSVGHFHHRNAQFGRIWRTFGLLVSVELILIEIYLRSCRPHIEMHHLKHDFITIAGGLWLKAHLHLYRIPRLNPLLADFDCRLGTRSLASKITLLEDQIIFSQSLSNYH